MQSISKRITCTYLCAILVSANVVLYLQLQTYQILTNDDHICSFCVFLILLPLYQRWKFLFARILFHNFFDSLRQTKEAIESWFSVHEFMLIQLSWTCSSSFKVDHDFTNTRPTLEWPMLWCITKNSLHNEGTGGPRIVRILGHQEIVLLQKSY